MGTVEIIVTHQITHKTATIFVQVVPEGKVTVPKLENKNIVLPVKIDSIPISGKGSIKSTLNPGEIQVLLINDLGIK